MDAAKAIKLLESEWEQPDGFLGRLREGKFDTAGFERFERLLRSIERHQGGVINRRLVSLLWYAPTFMSWQRERVAEQGGSIEELEVAITKTHNLVEEILGVP
jgi:hypothetical protein